MGTGTVEDAAGFMIERPVHRGSRDGVALAQELPYLRQELARTVGLGDKVITSSGSRFRLIATQSIRGDRNDWNVRERWIGLDAARRLVAVHDRKLDIHQY
jgi:hypothetical protein